MYATEYRLSSLDKVIMRDMNVHEYKWLQLSVTGELERKILFQSAEKLDFIHLSLQDLMCYIIAVNKLLD